MIDDQVIFPQNSSGKSSKNSDSGKKIVIYIGIIITVILIAAGSYILGAKNKENELRLNLTPTTASLPTLFSIENASPVPTLALSTSTKTQPSKTPTDKPASTPKLKSLTLNSVPALDGYFSSNGDGSGSLEIKAGRNESLVTRGFVSFNLDNLPREIEIQKAILRIYQSKITGNPYNVNGALKIDHLTYGNSLDNTDYGMAALISNITTVSNNTAIEWKEVDVTKTLINDISNARSLSQYRLHFVNETKGSEKEGDFVHFDSSNDYPENTNHHPQLIITFLF